MEPTKKETAIQHAAQIDQLRRVLQERTAAGVKEQKELSTLHATEMKQIQRDLIERTASLQAAEKETIVKDPFLQSMQTRAFHLESELSSTKESLQELQSKKLQVELEHTAPMETELQETTVKDQVIESAQSRALHL